MLKPKMLKPIIKGTIIAPIYKLLKPCKIFAPTPENLKKSNSFSVFTGTFFHKWAKKEMLKAAPIAPLQYNHISESCPFINAEHIN